MTLAFGDYEQSYPPEILRGYVAPVLSGAAARGATDNEEGAEVEPTTPPPNDGPESNAPEGAVPVDSTRTEPDGPAVVAVPADQLDEAAAAAEPTPTVRAPAARELNDAAGDDDGDDQLEAGDDERPRFTVTEGTPGTYEPEVSARERPRNVTELRALARPADPAPWAEGAYVLVGTTGKRAHWSGADWHGDESPGYPAEQLDDDADDTDGGDPE